MEKASYVVVEMNVDMIVDFTDIIFNKSVSCLSAVCLEVCGSLKTPTDRRHQKSKSGKMYC